MYSLYGNSPLLILRADAYTCGKTTAAAEWSGGQARTATTDHGCVHAMAFAIQVRPNKNQDMARNKNSTKRYKSCGFVITTVSGSEWNQVEPSKNQAPNVTNTVIS